MTYFHVFVSFDPTPDKQRCLLSDLSEAKLKASFVRPFNRGKNLLCGNEVVPAGTIRRITITTTEDKAEVVLRKYTDAVNEGNERRNRESRGIVFIGGIGFGLDDLANVGTKVTSKYITKAPDEAPSKELIFRILHNPWVVGIGAGVTVAATGALLKWS